MADSIVGFIFARGGSKGIPRKNIKMLAGKPLIAYAIESAHQSRLVDRVIVSTDDEEIAQVARDFGAEVPFIRPADLASDAAPERAAWQHALRHIEADEVRGAVDVFVCIPTTAPLRVASDIDCCVEAFLQGDCDIAITVSPASNSPYYNMVELDQEHYARLVIPPQESLHARQKSPLVYDMNTVAYAASASHVLHADYIFNGRVKAVIIPEERSLDIDTDLDWQFAEFLIERNSRG